MHALLIFLPRSVFDLERTVDGRMLHRSLSYDHVWRGPGFLFAVFALTLARSVIMDIAGLTPRCGGAFVWMARPFSSFGELCEPCGALLLPPPSRAHRVCRALPCLHCHTVRLGRITHAEGTRGWIAQSFVLQRQGDLRKVKLEWARCAPIAPLRRHKPGVLMECIPDVPNGVSSQVQTSSPMHQARIQRFFGLDDECIMQAQFLLCLPEKRVVHRAQRPADLVSPPTFSPDAKQFDVCIALHSYRVFFGNPKQVFCASCGHESHHPMLA